MDHAVAKRELFKLLAPFLRKKGFKRKGAVWFRLQHPDIYILIKYHKSRFSEEFFLTFGIAFLRISKDALPFIGDNWHIAGRYDEMLDSISDQKKKYLHFPEDIRELQPIAEDIIHNIDMHLLPKLEHLAHLENLSGEYKSKITNAGMLLQYIRHDDFKKFIDAEIENATR